MARLAMLGDLITEMRRKKMQEDTAAAQQMGQFKNLLIRDALQQQQFKREMDMKVKADENAAVFRKETQLNLERVRSERKIAADELSFKEQKELITAKAKANISVDDSKAAQDRRTEVVKQLGRVALGEARGEVKGKYQLQEAYIEGAMKLHRDAQNNVADLTEIDKKGLIKFDTMIVNNIMQDKSKKALLEASLAGKKLQYEYTTDADTAKYIYTTEAGLTKLRESLVSKELLKDKDITLAVYKELQKDERFKQKMDAWEKSTEQKDEASRRSMEVDIAKYIYTTEAGLTKLRESLVSKELLKDKDITLAVYKELQKDERFKQKMDAWEKSTEQKDEASRRSAEVDTLNILIDEISDKERNTILKSKVVQDALLKDKDIALAVFKELRNDERFKQKMDAWEKSTEQKDKASRRSMEVDTLNILIDEISDKERNTILKSKVVQDALFKNKELNISLLKGIMSSMSADKRTRVYAAKALGALEFKDIDSQRKMVMKYYDSLDTGSQVKIFMESGVGKLFQHNAKFKAKMDMKKALILLNGDTGHIFKKFKGQLINEVDRMILKKDGKEGFPLMKALGGGADTMRKLIPVAQKDKNLTGSAIVRYAAALDLNDMKAARAIAGVATKKIWDKLNNIAGHIGVDTGQLAFRMRKVRKKYHPEFLNLLERIAGDGRMSEPLMNIDTGVEIFNSHLKTISKSSEEDAIDMLNGLLGIDIDTTLVTETKGRQHSIYLSLFFEDTPSRKTETVAAQRPAVISTKTKYDVDQEVTGKTVGKTSAGRPVAHKPAVREEFELSISYRINTKQLMNDPRIRDRVVELMQSVMGDSTYTRTDKDVPDYYKLENLHGLREDLTADFEKESQTAAPAPAPAPATQKSTGGKRKPLKDIFGW